MALDAIVDLSHYNIEIDDKFDKLKEAGIAGIIHKATEGLSPPDVTFEVSRENAQKVGLLFGAYHFGTNDNGADQADHFLSCVQPDARTLLALDFEHNPSGSSMDLQTALAFLRRVHERTGRWPGLYSNVPFLSSALETLNGASKAASESDLRNCWLWLARYGNEPTPPAPWSTWTLWQYTDGSVGSQPHTIPGVGACDRSYFNGSLAELQRLWDVPVSI